MTVNELSERIKVVKMKDSEVIFRTADRSTLELGGMYYGVKDANGMIQFPQVGEEPTCVVIQVTPAPVDTTPSTAE